MEASWKDRTKRIGDHIIATHRGQCAVSIRFLAKAWSWTPARVNRFLKRIERQNMVSINSETGLNIITICNYEKFQNVGTAPETQAKQKRNTAETNNKKDSIPEERKDNTLSRFEEFWVFVPRKQGKGDARKAYVAALRKTDADQLLSSIKAYAASRIGEDPTFTVTPAKWLNSERWLDETQKMHRMKGRQNDDTWTPGNAAPNRRKDRSDPAIEQIARLAGL